MNSTTHLLTGNLRKRPDLSLAAVFWLGSFVLIALLTLVAPFWPGAATAASKTVAFAYAPGGWFNLGYDYLGRPIGAQLLLGGRELLLVSIICALTSQITGMAVGLWMAVRPKQRKYLQFPLDILLVMPMSIVALIAYRGIGASLYGAIPITTILSVPFTSRYYLSNAEPLVKSVFFEQARVAGDSLKLAIVREIIPILSKSIFTDLGQTFITAIYISTTVSFLGADAGSSSFLWSTMISKNLPGLGLNPYAVFAPIIAILLLTLPINLAVDSMEKKRTAVIND